MNRYYRSRLFSAVFVLVSSACCDAGELVHNFVNPSFGGNPLNGSYLLSNASAQNDYKDSQTTTSKKKTTTSSSSSAQVFAQQVDRLVTAALASRLVSNAFGVDPNALPDTISTLNTGLNTITVTPTETGTEVTIVDNATGARSVIFVPTYQ
jgi:curli production assembly/transport component CsgF